VLGEEKENKIHILSDKENKASVSQMQELK
jgi:hypothetical protein